MLGNLLAIFVVSKGEGQYNTEEGKEYYKSIKDGALLNKIKTEIVKKYSITIRLRNLL